MAFEFLEHTADLKFRASGDSFSAALTESAKALFTAIAGDSEIRPEKEHRFTIKIHKPQLLARDFLAELLYQFSAEHMLFSEFELDLKEAMGYKLDVIARGEPFDESRHKLIKEVKAVTYHDLVAEEREGGWVIEVICDT